MGEHTEHAIEARMFGELSISYQTVTISEKDNRSYKIWLFLAYLIHNRQRLVSREELLTLFGGGDRYADPGSALRITRRRARLILQPIATRIGKELIIRKGNACGWNAEAPVRVDAEEFERLCARAYAQTNQRARVACYRRAIRLFQGEFLSRHAGDLWVEPLTAYYHNLYLGALEETLPLMNLNRDAPEIAALCRHALQISPYHEPLYQYLMRSLMIMRDREGAEAVYKEVQDRLLNDLGIMPSEQTQTVYREVVQYPGSFYLPPEEIREALRETAFPTGALVCDYAVFKLFYQVEARSVDRRGEAIHIGILSVISKKNRTLSRHALERAMEQLGVQIRNTLRIGDVACCCSASQYLILLVMANQENSQMVCHRVAQAFARAYPHSPARIHSIVLPLEPLTETVAI